MWSGNYETHYLHDKYAMYQMTQLITQNDSSSDKTTAKLENLFGLLCISDCDWLIDLCNYVYGYFTNKSYQEDENICPVDVVMRYGQHSWNLYENIKLHDMHTIIIVFRQPNK